MKDYEAFQAALEDDPMYASQLSRSLSLVSLPFEAVDRKAEVAAKRHSR